jgi:Alpha/beta hydrolase domain
MAEMIEWEERAAMADARPETVMPVAGKPALLLGAYDLAPLGYQAEEFFLSGSATRYTLAGPPTSDGVWSVTPAASAAYKTRVVVIRPSDPATFNGTVLVEWLNVTSGQDMPAEWMVAHREILRRGCAYVAVSAQAVGVEGGASVMGIGAPLKKLDPARYGSLSHPGDAFAYDIFSQAGAALKAKASGMMMGPLKPERVIAMGESQSAMFLTTYVNAVDRRVPVYDGFFIHSRFGPSARLDGGRMDGSGMLPDARFRPDLRAPVLALITETDLIGARLPGYYAARRPDDAHLRVWELAGAAHADGYLFTGAFTDNGALSAEQLAGVFWPAQTAPGGPLAKPYNPGVPHHYVTQAAITALDQWLRTGRPPASTPLIALTPPSQAGSKPGLQTDAHGIARGGIRTPWTEVPTMLLSGVGNSGPFVGQLVGIGEPFDKATLAKLYPGGKDEYLRRFTAALEQAIATGHLLPQDRAEILAVAAINYDKAP